MSCHRRLTAALALCLSLLAPAAVAADDCLAQVRALFEAGAPLDPYQRPPHRQVNTIHDAEGNVTRVFTSFIETPLRTIAGIEGENMTLAIGNDVWTSTSSDGPWTAQQGFTGDRRAGHEADLIQRQANLGDVICHGIVEEAGARLQAFGFTTRTDPNEAMGGAWFGSTDTVYLDPGSGQVMIWEMRDFVSSWAPEPNGEHHRLVFSYDPSIKVTRPE